VILTTSSRAPAALEGRIERHLAERLGYAVPTYLRTPAELAVVARQRPFGAVELRAKGPALYIGFVKKAPGSGVRKKLLELKSATDELHVRGREVYWLRRARSMENLRLMAQLDRALGMPVTFRNLNTVEKLAAMHA
jgi:uncharacterized protein (DUF1697 family)